MPISPPPEQGRNPLKVYVSLHSREESEALARVLRQKNCEIAIADGYGRGSDIIVRKYILEKMPDAVFLSSALTNVIQYVEENGLERAARIFTVEVCPEGEKGFVEGQGRGKLRQYGFAQYGGVRGKKSSADIVTLGGLEGALDFAQNYFEILYREIQKKEKEWLEQNAIA